MDISLLQWLLYTTIILIFVFVFQEVIQPIDLRWSSLRRYKLPPGPRGRPIVGNLLDFWHHRKVGTMSTYFLSLRSHGSMTTLHMGSSLWVVLNTNHMVEEIFHKRAKITHERPPMPIAGDLVSRGMRSVTQNTAKWSELRRLMRVLLNSAWTKTFTDWQDLESVQLLLSYLEDPSQWYTHNSRYATGVMHGVIAGTRLTKTEEEMQEYRTTTMEFLGSIQSSAVDFFPWLANLPRPLQFWRRKWEATGTRHAKVFRSWWHLIKADAIQEKAPPSWVREVVLNPSTQFKGTEEAALYLTNTVVSAGGDNPRIAMNTFIMACLCNPAEYQKCREEVDRVCCGARLPGLADIPNMPYTCAFIKECLRWRPVVPMIPPHTASETFAFDDFVFPAGTTFVVNVPAVCADYPQSEVFKPERWIDGTGGETHLTRDFWGFGGGKRICIGYKAAQPALFLPLARLVYCFDFERAGAFDDRKVNAWGATEPFPVRVRVRSEAHQDLILREGRSRGFLC